MMQPIDWRDWFTARPCRAGWRSFVEALDARGGNLQYAVKQANHIDVQWGALYTHRPILLATIAICRNEREVLWCVAHNDNTTIEVLDFLGYHKEPIVSEEALINLERRGYYCYPRPNRGY